MKTVITFILLLSSISFAIPGNTDNLQNAPEINERIEQLKAEGWKVSGEHTLISLDSYYYTNSGQGQTLLLTIPINSRSGLRTSCVAALFSRGGSVNYVFRGFTQIGAFCQ